MMNTKEMIAIMQAYVDGHDIEWSTPKNDISWQPLPRRADDEDHTALWAWDVYAFRIVTKLDWINWNHVSSEYRFLVRNEDGTAYVCKEVPEPILDQGYWHQPYGNCVRVDAFASYQRGNLPWYQSLLERAP